MPRLSFLLFVALIAVVPCVFTLWQGRRLAKLADDPALPERLLVNRGRNSAVWACCLAILVASARQHLAWALPLLIVMRAVAAYPLRKRLYGETWSLGAYLSFFSRLIVATFGFWILLAATPSLIMLTGSHDWVGASCLAIVLLGWNQAYSTVFRAILRARPVDDPVLVTRFAQMLKQGGLPEVTLEQVDLHGGVFANAVALPSARRPMVLVSSTLVERLDHEEAAAILAHELAHIEHFNPRRLRSMGLVSYAQIAVAVLLSPVARSLIPQTLIGILVLWPIVLVVAMALRAQHRQKHETASDLRALALGGDPEALIRALTKLHAFARLPRRWDTELERHATHPSLARRIQAIHEAAGTPPALLGEAATFAAADASSSVTFYDDRLLWHEGPSASHTIEYGQVKMLRVDARRSRAPRLVAVDCANRRWTIVLQPTDVARAQATLDVVDRRLAAASSPPIISLAVSRALAVIVLSAALAVNQLPVALLGWIALILPVPPVTAAAGAAAVGGAVLIWRDHFVWVTDTQPWIALALMVCGVGSIAVTIVNRRERTPAFISPSIGVLTVAALAAWTAIMLSGIDAVDLHYAAIEWPSAAVLTLALAGAAAFARWPALRYASVPLGVAGFAAAVLGSSSFLDRFARDPFVAQGGSVTVKTIAAAARDEFTVPFEVSALRLSPSGHFVALDSENDDDETTIHAGRAGGPLTGFTADDAVFMDEGRLLLLERQRGASVLRVVDLHGDRRDGWSLRVPLSAARMSFDLASNTWALLGWNRDGDIVNAVGTVGEQTIREECWKSPVDDIDDIDALSVSTRDVLALETQHRSAFPGGGPLSRWAAIVGRHSSMESRFWTMSQRGSLVFMKSRLEVRCRGSAGDEGTTCTAFDGARTGFFAVNPTTRRSTVLASVPGHFYFRTAVGRGWFAGWWNHEPVLLRPTTREAIRVTASDGTRFDQLAIVDGTLGAASGNAHGSTVRLYSLESAILDR